MRRFDGFIKEIIVYVVFSLSILILLYLTVASMNATVYISEYEKCFYCKDEIFSHCCVIATVIFFFIFVRRYDLKNIKDRRFARLSGILVLILYGMIIFNLYSHIRLLPIFDQNQVFQIAGRMTNYNFIDFLKGGYGEKWTNQWGYLILLMTEFKLFGVRNTDAVYVMNIFFMIGTVWGLGGFAKRFLKNRSVIVLTAVCLFVPLWSFFTFIYGNIPSWFFSIIAINLVYDFYENDSMLEGILGAIFISVAVMLKTTQLIFFLACIIYIITQSFREKNVKHGMIKRVVLLVISLVLYWGFAQSVHLYMENTTGMTLGKGVPRITHIAMAMHEDSDASGWYDGYIDTVYEENDYDADMTSQAAMTDLMNSLHHFRLNPANAVGFFSRKVLSQWIEPTCESIFILLNRYPYSDTGQYNVNALPLNRIGRLFIQFMDRMQTVIYFGAFIFFSNRGIQLIGYRRRDESLAAHKETIDDMFAGMVLCGAFVFYIFWEANSQYALFYELLLVPCAVSGYENIAGGITDIYRNHLNERSLLVLSPPAIVLFLAVISAVFPARSAIGRLLAPTWSTEQYRVYLSEMIEAGIKEYTQMDADHTLYATGYDERGKARFAAGRYYIMPSNDTEHFLIPSNDMPGASVITGDNGDNRIILTSRDKGYTLRFQSTQLVLDVENASTAPGTRVQQYDQNGDPSQIFSLTPMDDGSFLIYYDNGDDLVLTENEDGNITVEPLENGNPNQRWTIVSE